MFQLERAVEIFRVQKLFLRKQNWKTRTIHLHFGPRAVFFRRICQKPTRPLLKIRFMFLDQHRLEEQNIDGKHLFRFFL